VHPCDNPCAYVYVLLRDKGALAQDGEDKDSGALVMCAEHETSRWVALAPSKAFALPSTSVSARTTSMGRASNPRQALLGHGYRHLYGSTKQRP
jgi:hypothetical protein